MKTTVPSAARRGRAALAAAILVGSLTVGCGSDTEDAAAPKGWKTLDTERVSVAYPESYKEQGAAERDKSEAAAAALTEDGRTVGRISVELNFMKAGDVDMAATGAEARIQMGATPKGREDIDVTGTDEAKRIDYEFTSDGAENTANKGTRMSGVMVTGIDSQDEPFLVAIDAKKGDLSEGDLSDVLKSITVK